MRAGTNVRSTIIVEMPADARLFPVKNVPPPARRREKTHTRRRSDEPPQHLWWRRGDVERANILVLASNKKFPPLVLLDAT